MPRQVTGAAREIGGRRRLGLRIGSTETVTQARYVSRELRDEIEECARSRWLRRGGHQRVAVPVAIASYCGRRCATTQERSSARLVGDDLIGALETASSCTRRASYRKLLCSRAVSVADGAATSSRSVPRRFHVQITCGRQGRFVSSSSSSTSCRRIVDQVIVA